MAAYDKFEITSEGYILHDDAHLSGEGEETIYKNALSNLRNCDYCSTKLLKIEDEISGERSRRDYSLWYCKYCRFWQARVYSDPLGGCMPPPDHLAYVSKLREFDTSLPDGCSEELASYIRRHPNFWHSMDPTHFERLVADVFQANYRNAEVIHVGRPKDGGVDVLFVDAEREEWLIQAKRRESPKYSEKVDTIRNALGTMVVNGKQNGIVVSTAQKFSRYAIQETVAAKEGPYRMRVELVDKSILNRMLDPILPDRPWFDPIREVDQEIAEYLTDKIPSDNQLDLFATCPPLQLK